MLHSSVLLLLLSDNPSIVGTAVPEVRFFCLCGAVWLSCTEIYRGMFPLLLLPAFVPQSAKKTNKKPGAGNGEPQPTGVSD